MLVGTPAHDAIQQIRDNTIREQSKAAIQVSDGAAPTIEANRLLSNGGGGLYFFGGAGGHVTRNLIDGSGGAGIRIEHSSPALERNTVCAGAGAGTSAHTLTLSPRP